MTTLSLPAQTRLSSSLLQSTLLLVDGGSADLEPLQHGARLPLRVLEPGQDPLRQISLVLAQARQHQPVTSLHLVAHGRAGAIRLNQRWFDRAALAAASAEISQWNLETLVLWGCEVGADHLFVDLLAEISGAHVLASHQVVAAATSQQPTEFGLSLSDLYAPEVLSRWNGRLAEMKLDGDLNFANGIKLTNSDFNPVFTTYLYQNAYVSPDGKEKLDALVTLTDIANGGIVEFDSNTLQYDEPDWFQPIVSVFGKTFDPAATSTEAKFLFTFIESGSVSSSLRIDNSALSVSSSDPNQLLLNGSSNWYSTVDLSDITWNSYDIDGRTVGGNPTSARQFVGSSGFIPGKIQTFLSPFNPADPTNPPDQSRLAVTFPTPSTFRATSTIGFDVTDPPGTTGFLRQAVSVGLKPLSAFTATLGDSGWDRISPYQAFFSLDFTKGSLNPQPEIIFAKTVVGSSQVGVRQPVTFEYTLTSVSGSFAGSSIIISDDNATPTFKLDDFGFDASRSVLRVDRPPVSPQTPLNPPRS